MFVRRPKIYIKSGGVVHLVLLISRLQLVLKKMRHDKRVDALAATLSLFKTQAHIVARFAAYAGYPTSVWRMTKKFNAPGYLRAVDEFLIAPDSELDYGYSLPLRAEALSTGCAASAKSFLLSDEVQSELTALVVEASATPLDVERKHQQDKRSEKRRVSTLARMSRNSILQRYNVFQQQALVRSKSDAALLK